MNASQWMLCWTKRIQASSVYHRHYSSHRRRRPLHPPHPPTVVVTIARRPCRLHGQTRIPHYLTCVTDQAATRTQEGRKGGTQENRKAEGAGGGATKTRRTEESGEGGDQLATNERSLARTMSTGGWVLGKWGGDIQDGSTVAGSGGG